MRAVHRHVYIEDNLIEKFVDKFGVVKGELLVILVCWFPLVLFNLLTGDGMLDVGTHVKYLIAVPMFIVTYPMLIKKLNWILKHIQKAELVDEEDLHKLDRLIYKQDLMTNSKKIKFTLILLAYLTEACVYINIENTRLAWRSFERPAGWWFHLISQPLFYTIFYAFLLRGYQWWQLLYKLSKLKLRIQPAHGDQTGGLGFMSTVLNAFIFPAFAFSSTVASGAATLIIEKKMTLPGLQTTFIIYCVFIVIALITPLFFFFPVLLNARAKSIHSYGVLVSEQLNDFNKKWLKKIDLKNDKLSVADFSAVTDYGSEVARVHSMKLYPLKLVDLLLLAFFVSIPFLPVYSLEMPWKDIFKKLFEVVF